MTQHTPGPWMISRADTGLTSIYPSGSPERVADIYCPLNRAGTLEANARLIAAAPMLLKALRTLKACVRCTSCDEIAETAIAKATE